MHPGITPENAAAAAAIGRVPVLHLCANGVRHTPMPPRDAQEGACPIKMGMGMTARALNVVTYSDVRQNEVPPVEAAQLARKLRPQIDRREWGREEEVVDRRRRAVLA